MPMARKMSSMLNNIHIEGNTVFNNGSIGYSTSREMFGIYKRNILIGGMLIAQNPVVKNNYTYYPNASGESLNLGYRAGSDHAIVKNNYFAGGSIEMGGTNNDLLVSENTFVGFGFASLSNVPAGGGNNWSIFSPGVDQIFVRPNQYEPGRANITIYNWHLLDTVTLGAEHLKGVEIRKGDRFRLHNVQDYFEDVISGVYNGESIEISMNGRSVAQPLGLDFKPDSTFPEFGAFVLIVEPK
jgi:hypothetical protein